jgi:hypothetical protein
MPRRIGCHCLSCRATRRSQINTQILMPSGATGHSGAMTDIDILHIGKTGGTALKAALRNYMDKTGDKRFRLHRHEMSLPRVLREDPLTQVFFVVRDPVSRYISGFSSRLRRGQPARFRDWRPGEAEAFRCFTSANSLAEALSDDDRWRRAAARLAMHTIGHVRAPLSDWLKSIRYLERNKSRICFIGLQPRLNADMALIREKLKLPASFGLPIGDVEAHRAPATDDPHLSQVARSNIVEWYRQDFELYNWCLEFRADLGLTNSAQPPNARPEP